MKELRLNSLESGFERLKAGNLIRAPFFFLAILFVLFDLELILLLPGVVSTLGRITQIALWSYTIILILVTLFIEWSWCGLKWQI